MFLFEITEKGIEKVSIRATSEKDEARDLQLWPVVRRGLQRLNREILNTVSRPEKQIGECDQN